MNVICIYGSVSGKISVWEGMELKIVLELSCLIISQVYPSVWIPDVMIMCINVSSIVHSNR